MKRSILKLLLDFLFAIRTSTIYLFSLSLFYHLHLSIYSYFTEYTTTKNRVSNFCLIFFILFYFKFMI